MIAPAIREAILVGLDRNIADLEDAEAAEIARVERLIAARQIADGDHYWQAGFRLREKLHGLRTARVIAAEELPVQDAPLPLQA